MTGFIIGLITTAAIIAFAEIFRKIDLKFYASLNLAAIPFIYIGFSIDPHTLILTVPGASFFLFFAYWGYKKSYILTVAGLALHGVGSDGKSRWPPPFGKQLRAFPRLPHYIARRIEGA